jgi:hypothetical protein
MRGRMGWLASPLPAVALHVIALWAWHVPAAYGAALRGPWVHAAEHGSFLGTAMIFWWAVLHRRGSLARMPGVAMLALFALSMATGALGALLTFSAAPWYASHMATASAWGFTPLEDQQVAGLVMWIPGSLVYLTAVTLVFVRWMRTAERRSASPAPWRMEGTAAAALRMDVGAGDLEIGAGDGPAPSPERGGENTCIPSLLLPRCKRLNGSGPARWRRPTAFSRRRRGRRRGWCEYR